MKMKNNRNKGAGVFITTERSGQQIAERMLANITQISRPTMMENKTGDDNRLYGGVEGAQLWLVQGSEKKNGLAPQRVFSGFIGKQEEKTVVFGRFGFVRGFHLMWLLCTVIGGAAMLMMLHTPVVAIITVALCLICWIAAAIGGCVKYKEEEQAVRKYLEEVCADEELPAE